MALKRWQFAETLDQTDLNDMVSDFPKSAVVGLLPPAVSNSSSSGSYAGTPEMSQQVKPMLGRYLHVKFFTSVSGGGTGSIKIDLVGPTGTDTLATLTTTSGAGETKEATYDLSALTTNGDVRGEDVTLNFYLKTTAGTVVVAGMVLMNGEGSSSNDYLVAH